LGKIRRKPHERSRENAQHEAREGWKTPQVEVPARGSFQEKWKGSIILLRSLLSVKRAAAGMVFYPAKRICRPCNVKP